MLRDKIINLGGAFNYIGKKVLNLYKMVSKKIIESITLILTNSTGDDLIDYKIYGNSKQATTTGKNLMPFTNQDFTINNVRYYVQNGDLYINGNSTGETTSSNTNFKNNFNFTLPVGTYKIQQGNNQLGLYLRKYNDDSLIFSNPNYVEVNSSRTFTLTEETKLYFGFYVYQQTFNNVDTQIMVSVDGGDYEPYTNGPSPNPDYLQEIKSVGDLVESGEYQGKYKIPVICSGKNIAQSNWASDFVTVVNDSTKAKLDAKDNRRCLYYSATAGYGSYDTKNLSLGINFKENTQYTISGYILKESSTSNTITIRYTDGTEDSFTTVSAVDTWEKKVKTSAQGKTIAFIRPSYTSGLTYIDLDTWQIEEGTTETDYEPYHESITTNIYLDEPLRRIGDAKDYIDFKNGQRFNKIGRLVVDTVAYFANGGVYVANDENYVYGYASYYDSLVSSSFLGYSTHFKNFEDNLTAGSVVTTSSFSFGGSAWAKFRIFIDKSVLNDTSTSSAARSSLGTWLQENKPEFYYISKEITEETVDLPSIPTFEGTTIITFGSEIDPSNAWVQYYAEEES